MKYYIATFGCQTNQSDSERMSAILEKAGHKKTSSQDDADLIVANACSVRQSAIDRIHGIAKKNSKLDDNNKKIIILTGCVVESDRKKLSEKFDIVLDIRDMKKLPNLIKSVRGMSDIPRKIRGRAQANDIERWKTAEKSISYFNIEPNYQSPFQAEIPIMTGCNNFCTYCAVPYTRGKEVSRPALAIIKEVKKLITKGYKEITLLGQNVNSYKDESANINFSKLLKLVNDIPGNFWLRFHSSHPKDFTDELIDTVAKCEKVTKYISLPVQSGNNQVLKRMNRPYTVAQYKKLVKKIRKQMPAVSISTDIIVGFPGETKKQFNDSIKLFKEIKFDMAYIARYSPRPGTTAEKIFKDSVTGEEKERRDHQLTEVMKKISFNINKKLVDKPMQVLLDREIHRNNGDWIVGKTRSFKTVKIPITSQSQSKLIGNFIDVKITKALDLGLIGKVL